MVTDAFLGVMYTIVHGIWSLLPTWTIELDNDAGGDFKQAVMRMNEFAPAQEVFNVMTWSAGLLTVLFAMKAIFKVVGWIRGSG